MVRAIYAFGFSVLKRPTEEIKNDYQGLPDLIDDMFETMYNAKGIGLAAPQIGLGLRIFVVDTTQLDDEEGENSGIKKVFVNPKITAESGDFWSYEEGCLSIPQITGEVDRISHIQIEFLNEKFEKQKLTLDGINARVVQHEYDHLEGILFTDRLKPLKKRLIKRRLDQVKKGNVDVSYKMKFKKI